MFNTMHPKEKLICRYIETFGTMSCQHFEKYSTTRGLRRGGLTLTCGSAHARNGRGCRQIEAVKAKALPRGAIRDSIT